MFRYCQPLILIPHQKKSRIYCVSIHHIQDNIMYTITTTRHIQITQPVRCQARSLRFQHPYRKIHLHSSDIFIHNAYLSSHFLTQILCFSVQQDKFLCSVTLYVSHKQWRIKVLEGPRLKTFMWPPPIWEGKIIIILNRIGFFNLSLKRPGAPRSRGPEPCSPAPLCLGFKRLR